MERYNEHLEDIGSKEESHTAIHSKEEHEGQFSYKVKVSKVLSTTLSRQVTEAVQI